MEVKGRAKKRRFNKENYKKSVTARHCLGKVSWIRENFVDVFLTSK